MKRKLSIILVLVFLLAGCASMQATAKKWNDLTPKQKSTAMWQIYSGQYDQYLKDFERFQAAESGPIKTALAQSLQARKKILKEAFDAVKAYDSFAGTGLIPMEDLERKALEVLGRIGGM